MPNHFVQKLKNLAELNSADVGALAALTSQPRGYASKQDMIREGDRPGPVFVILEGWACPQNLPSAPQIMAFLGLATVAIARRHPGRNGSQFAGLPPSVSTSSQSTDGGAAGQHPL